MKGRKDMSKFPKIKILIIITVIIIMFKPENSFNVLKNFVHFFNTDEYASKYIYVIERNSKNVIYKKMLTLKHILLHSQK